jgi:hypothetical protein
MANQMAHQTTAGHETEDASVPGIVYAGAGLAVGSIVVALIVYGVFQYLANQPITTAPPNPLTETDQQLIPPTPRIEEHPAIELKDLHAEEDQILNTYGWTDKNAGIVRIPLERAMELQLERGFPTRKETAP